MRVCVVGLGQVGLATFHELGSRYREMVGVDTDARLVRRLAGSGLPVTIKAERPETIDAWIVAVSTGRDLANLWRVLRGIRPRAGAVIAIESTLPPGTMWRIKDLYESRGIMPGRDVFLVHCPHRILIGEETSVFQTPRLLGGVTPACLERGLQLYAPFAARVIACPDVRVVETAKIVENALRYVEIAIAEGLKMYCDQSGLDFDRLRRVVNTKGNVELKAAEWGIGGECLSKDIGFLSEATGLEILRAAIATDEAYRESLFRRLSRFPSVLIRGVTYKRGVKSVQQSRALELATRLRESGVEVGLEDPLLGPGDMRRMGFPSSNGRRFDAVAERGRVVETAARGADGGVNP